MLLTHALFIVVVLMLIWSLYRLHRNPEVDFNLLDLLMENGRVSKVSCIVMGAFFVHSWIMLSLQLSEPSKMSEGYLTIYGATWVAPLLARLMLTGGKPTSHKEKKVGVKDGPKG